MKLSHHFVILCVHQVLTLQDNTLLISERAVCDLRSMSVMGSGC
jgi:hypothetical protein